MQILVKSTQECNLNCSYCFDREERVPGRLTLADVEEICKKDTTKQIHTWTWFGGEPLLMGIDFYRKADKIIKKYLPNVKYSFQTNATLLTQEWIDLAKEIGANFGISFDGINNEVTRGVPASILVEKIKLLKRNNMSTGTIAVVNEQNMKYLLDNYLFFKSIGVTSIAFNKVFTSHRSNGINKEFMLDYLRWFKTLFIHWMSDTDPIPIRQITDLLEAVITKKGHLWCSRAGRCEQGIFGVNPEGRIEPCDRWFPAEYKDPRTIYEYKDLNEALHTKAYMHRKVTREKRVKEFCKACPIYDYCHGGCPANAVFYNDGLAQNKTMCAIMRAEWTIMFNQIKNMMPEGIKNPVLQRILAEHRPISLIKEVLDEIGDSNEIK